MPFTARDNEALEASIASGAEQVPVEHGRYLAMPAQRKLRALYWSETEWPLIRASWFYRPFENPSRVRPFGEADATTIEGAAADLVAGREAGPFDCELIDTPGGGVVQIGIKSDSEKRELTFSLWRTTADGVPRRLPVLRGLPADAPLPQDPEQPGLPKWVIFLTHGIGEALRNPSCDTELGAMRFRRHCATLRANLNATLPPGEGRVEFIPIEWLAATYSADMVEMLERVSLPTLQRARDFTNLALRDAMLYTQGEWQKRVEQEVRSQLEAKLELFCANNEGFKERLNADKSFIGIMGHSLGSVILADLLYSKSPPNVPIDAFFLLGSPLALLQCVRGQLKAQRMPAKRCFNIFHPHDPIAYRLEPLVNPHVSTIPAADIPHRGGQRLHVALSTLGTSLWGWWAGGSAAEENPDVESILAANGGFRVDWVLQASPGEAASEWISAMSSHFQYWEHEDVINFIVERLQLVAKAREPAFL